MMRPCNSHMLVITSLLVCSTQQLQAFQQSTPPIIRHRHIPSSTDWRQPVSLENNCIHQQKYMISKSVRKSGSTRLHVNSPKFQMIVAPIRKASQKFMDRPATYLLIPVVAAFVGWFTNWLAVQMIFYPVKFWGIPIFRRQNVPLGLIG